MRRSAGHVPAERQRPAGPAQATAHHGARDLYQLGDLAVTPDGRTIAYDTYLCGKGRGELGVVDIPSRTVRVWTTGFVLIRGLSLSADGRLLVFDELARGTRILRTGSAPGPLLARSNGLSRTMDWAALSGDGNSVYACRVLPPGSPSIGTMIYYQYRIATGRQRVIARSMLQAPYCWASLDPSGHYLLVQYPTTVPHASGWQRPVILDLRTTGHATAVHAPVYYGPLDVAW